MTTKDYLEYAKIFLHQTDYDSLKNFFMRIWNSKSDFIVFCTQRASMLHRIFLPNAPSGVLTSNHFITADAFLLYAEEFAKAYKESGCFPSVIFVEDVRFCGINTDCIFCKFQQLILEEINKNQKLSDNDTYYLERALKNAIKIYVYAMHEYQKDSVRNFKVNTVETKKSSDELISLLERIADVIQKSNVVNTNFHFSIKVSESLALKDGNEEKWQALKWKYRNEKQIIYFSANANKESFVSSVCAHGFECYNRNNQIFLTGVPGWIELTKEKFDESCNVVKLALETSSPTSDFKWIRKLLECNSDNILSVKAQFISFVLSVLSVYAFCKDCGLNFDKQQMINNSNAEFIAINFGRLDDVWSEIEEFCTNKNLLDNLQKALNNDLAENFKSLLGIKVNDFIEKESKEINSFFENVFYQARTLKDIHDYEILCNLKKLSTNTRRDDVVFLSELFAKSTKYQMSNGKQMDYYACFASQIALMNNGLITMTFEYNKEESKIECAFKADELATFILPRRLFFFISALCLVEKEEYEEEKVIKLLKEFIEYILSTNNNPENEMECEALKCLKEQGNELVDVVYKSGRKVRDLVFILPSRIDFQEQKRDDNETYLSFQIYFAKRQKYYESLAKSFISKKWRERFG